MKPSIKIAIGLFIFLSTITFIVVWEIYIKDEIMSEEVLVVMPGTEIMPATVIKGDEFLVEKRRRESLIEGVVLAEDLDQIVGHMSSYHMVGNSMISKEHIDFDDIIPNPEKGEAIRPIPSDWIYSKPGSLRRKDRIDIYMIPKGFGLDEAKGAVIPVNIDLNDDEQSEEEDASLNEIAGATSEEMANLGLTPILKGIPVIFAKDGTNNEVVDRESGGGEGQRLNASGSISELELNLNEVDFNNMMSFIQDGHQMYITYH